MKSDIMEILINVQVKHYTVGSYPIKVDSLFGVLNREIQNM